MSIGRLFKIGLMCFGLYSLSQSAFFINGPLGTLFSMLGLGSGVVLSKLSDLEKQITDEMASLNAIKDSVEAHFKETTTKLDALKTTTDATNANVKKLQDASDAQSLMLRAMQEDANTLAMMNTIFGGTVAYGRPGRLIDSVRNDEKNTVLQDIINKIPNYNTTTVLDLCDNDGKNLASGSAAYTVDQCTALKNQIQVAVYSIKNDLVFGYIRKVFALLLVPDPAGDPATNGDARNKLFATLSKFLVVVQAINAPPASQPATKS